MTMRSSLSDTETLIDKVLEGVSPRIIVLEKLGVDKRFPIWLWFVPYEGYYFRIKKDEPDAKSYTYGPWPRSQVRTDLARLSASYNRLDYIPAIIDQAKKEPIMIWVDPSVLSSIWRKRVASKKRHIWGRNKGRYY